MKSFFSVLLVFLFFGAVGHAQIKYLSHHVKEGETISSITRQYNITQEELFRMNPEVKNGLKHNTVLIIPTSETVKEQNGVKFKTHTVKRRETLFSLSQLYNVSQEDIKKYNKHLYSETLRNGEEIKIPVRSAAASISSGTQTVPGATVEKISEASPSTHTVAAKETKFGIARKYGITVADINALNPEVAAEENLPLGITLKVPDSPSEESAVPDEENFTYYEVQPKEGFYRLKANFGWTEEEVKKLNPDAEDGLKEGMILKMPKAGKGPGETAGTPYALKNAINLENNLTNLSTKDVVVFLPFDLNRVEMDSLSNTEQQMMSNASLRIALDFYSGVRVAAEFAKKKGISVNLHIFDTREMQGGTLTLFDRKNIQKTDVVIGPLRQAMVERVASDLQGRNIPVISPLSNRQSKMYPNFIQSIPSNNYLEERMIAYLSANSMGKNIYLISDGKKTSQRQKLINAIPGLITIDPADGYVKQQEITNRLRENGENWVILETTNAALVSSTISTLNSLRRSRNVRLFTLDKNDAFEYSEISNVHLSRLEFTFPSVNKSTDVKDVTDFVTAYKDQYGIMPNRFASRGFDVTYDALLRLAYSESIFATNDALDAETIYNENKFHYKKNPNGGYHNTSVYILKYNKDLLLEEVK